MADPAAVDLSTPQRIHIVAIGGAGMSAIASVLHAMGHTVTGSDLRDSAVVERLRGEGIVVTVGHDAENLPPLTDVVAISTAIPDDNPERRAAVERGLPVLRRAEILAAIAATRRTVAVAGTHGKTTTSAMLALVLQAAGLRPSFIIGGNLTELGTGAAWDQGELFVVEADESDGTFLELGASVAVVTNVEPDHLEHYGSFEALRAAFDRFLLDVDGPRVACVDDHWSRLLAEVAGAATYGTDETAAYRMVDVVGGRDGTRWTIEHDGERLGDLHLPLPGLHNARNATAAVVTALLLGAPLADATAAIGRFAGVGRRFEPRGRAGGVTFVDDYAHLPTEVRGALGAARDGDWDRVVCVFQPHRYSRTAALWPEFADAFADADLLVVTDIYTADEAPRPGITGKLVLDAVLDHDPWRRAAWMPDREGLVAFLTSELRPGDLCLTLGAGDLTTLPDVLVDALDRRAPARS